MFRQIAPAALEGGTVHQVADQSHRFGFADSGPDSLVAWLNPKMDPRVRPSLGEIETSQRGPADRYSDEGHVKGVGNNPIVGLRVRGNGHRRWGYAKVPKRVL